MSDELYELRINGMSEESAKAFTRTTPDVPELVRYDLIIEENYPEATYIDKVATGEYVRHDQADAMIAIEQANYKAMEDSKNYWKKCAHKAEAELDQIKAQEPYGYIDGPHFSTEPIEGWIPLYAASVAGEAETIERCAERLLQVDANKYVYAACEGTSKVYKFQAVLRALSGKEPS